MYNCYSCGWMIDSNNLGTESKKNSKYLHDHKFFCSIKCIDYYKIIPKQSPNYPDLTKDEIVSNYKIQRRTKKN